MERDGVSYGWQSGSLLDHCVAMEKRREELKEELNNLAEAGSGMFVYFLQMSPECARIPFRHHQGVVRAFGS
jgi:hypothetical protein